MSDDTPLAGRCSPISSWPVIREAMENDPEARAKAQALSERVMARLNEVAESISAGLESVPRALGSWGNEDRALSCVSTWSPPEPQPKVPAGPAEGQDTNSRVAAFLRDRPHATSRETAEEIGKSDQRVRTTSAWKEHRKKLREQQQEPEVGARPMTPAMLAVIDSKDRDPAEIAAERELQETQEESIEVLERKYLEGANRQQESAIL